MTSQRAKRSHGATRDQRRLIELARSRRLFRARDLQPLGIARRHLATLLADGVLLRSGRGIYALADAPASENRSLAEAAARVTGGVVCLLSALRLHGLTTQNPWQVWLAIQPSSRKPRVDHPPLRIVRFSGAAYTDGIERHRIEGVQVRVYSAAKTVADCFKYRNKIGIDIAMEALRDAWSKRAATSQQLWHFAKVSRVANIMRPYLESVLHT